METSKVNVKCLKLINIIYSIVYVQYIHMYKPDKVNDIEWYLCYINKSPTINPFFVAYLDKRYS